MALFNLVATADGYTYAPPPTVGNQNYYCARSDVEDVLSAAGVDYGATDDNDNGLVQEKVYWAIGKASQRINFKINKRYAPAALVGHPWTVQTSAILAAVNLCRRRGNPAPEALLEMKRECDEEIDDLEHFRNNLNGVPERFLRQPGVIALTVDRRYSVSKVRVNTQLSGGIANTPTSLIQFTDVASYYLYF